MVPSTCPAEVNGKMAAGYSLLLACFAFAVFGTSSTGSSSGNHPLGVCPELVLLPQQFAGEAVFTFEACLYGRRSRRTFHTQDPESCREHS